MFLTYNIFSQLLAPLICTNVPGKDDSHETFAIICDKVREHN